MKESRRSYNGLLLIISMLVCGIMTFFDPLLILADDNPTGSSRSGEFEVELVGRWPFGPSYAVAIDESRNLAFLGSGSAVLIFNISNPATPAKISSIITPGLVEGLFYSNNLLYVAHFEAGVRIIDVSNPSDPSEAGFYDTPGYANGVLSLLMAKGSSHFE